MWRHCLGAALLCASQASATEVAVEQSGITPVANEDPGGGQWLQSRGNAQNLGAVELTAPESIRPKPWTFEGSGRVWGYTPGMAVWSSPAIGLVNDRAVVVVGSYDHNVYCLDAATGTPIWKFTTGDGVYSAPTIWDSGEQVYVFAASSDRLVYGLDATIGRRLWIHSVQDYRPTLGGARLSSPVVGKVGAQDAVFFGHWVWDRSLTKSLQLGGLSAVNARDGKLLWNTDLGDNEVAAPTYAEVDGQGRLFVGTQNGNLFALDAQSGATLWRRVELDAVRGAPAVALIDGAPAVIMASKYGMVRALDAATGRPLWQYKAQDRITGSAAVARVGEQNLVFVGSYDRTLMALQLETGQPVWRYWTRGGIFASPAVMLDDERSVVVTTSWDHHLHGVAAHNGDYLWVAFTGRPIWDTLGQGDSTWSSPSAAKLNGDWMVYVGSYNGVMYGLSVKQLALEVVKSERSNVAFWVSLPIAMATVAGGAVVLTRRHRGRRRKRLS